MVALAWLKLAHIALAAASVGFFALRARWAMVDRSRLSRPWLRITPHLLDTLLLASGVALLVATAQWPWHHPWLAAKLTALLVYIGFGFAALRAPTRRGRLAVTLAALATAAYIAAVALAKDPLPFFP